MGLMYRNKLAPDRGMIFPFDPPRDASFWMRNTLIPLDMIFVRADGSIANIAANTVPYSRGAGAVRWAGCGSARNCGWPVGRTGHQARRQGRMVTICALPRPQVTRQRPASWECSQTPVHLVGRCVAGARRSRRRRNGEEVGRDEAGNVYFRHRKDPARRWVIYDGSNDSSRVPPGWNAWLRGTIDDLPEKSLPLAPQIRTGSGAQPDRYHGRLSALADRLPRKGIRPASTGDYEAWKPE